MGTAGQSTRIQFLRSTCDDDGQIVHECGETISGEIMSRNCDFLLVRTTAGGCMYVDTSRTDLYLVELI